ncbi:MAG: SMC-Scp complex subunit ScpB [Ruminococcaceae bacterium]|nr:SMC-Scp complex subunit ScpB [Oscillospiraceae bacterium]
MERAELKRILEAILFAAGESVETERIAKNVGCDVDEIDDAARELMDELAFDRRGIRIVHLGNAYQMCSSGEMSEYVTKTLETRKPPKLSASQLETLTIIAYYQPATKAYVEQIRGVDSSYSVGALLNKHLIEEAGRLNVPGRPILYRTTPDFLRTFGLESIEDLPEIEKMQFGKIELPEEEKEGTEDEQENHGNFE